MLAHNHVTGPDHAMHRMHSSMLAEHHHRICATLRHKLLKLPTDDKHARGMTSKQG